MHVTCYVDRKRKEKSILQKKKRERWKSFSTQSRRKGEISASKSAEASGPKLGYDVDLFIIIMNKLTVTKWANRRWLAAKLAKAQHQVEGWRRPIRFQ